MKPKVPPSPKPSPTKGPTAEKAVKNPPKGGRHDLAGSTSLKKAVSCAVGHKY